MNTGQEVIETETVISKHDFGVIMDQALNFSGHINSNVYKANRNLRIIFRTFTFTDKEMFLNLYKLLMRLHLEYAVTVGARLYKKDMIIIEKVQRRARKEALSQENKSFTLQ